MTPWYWHKVRLTKCLCIDGLCVLAWHYSDVIMGAVASQITSLTMFYSTVYSGADKRKHQSSASLAFVPGIHWWPVNFPAQRPVTRKMFPFDDVIMSKPWRNIRVVQWATLTSMSSHHNHRIEITMDSSFKTLAPADNHTLRRVLGWST